MNWSDERYVRVYTRDTPEWQCLSFLAKGLFLQLLRKVDRAGVLPLGKLGRRAVAVAVGHPGEWPRLEDALEELLADGCIRIEGELLVAPNFIEAQEAEASDAARAKKHRERVRDLAKSGLKHSSQNVTQPSREPESRDGGITNRDGGITECAATVTPSRTVPSRTVPPEEKREAPVSRLPSRHEALARLYPATAALVEASGGRFVHPSKPETKTAVEAAIAALDLAVALDAAERSCARHGKAHLGWCLDDLVAARQPAAAPAAPAVDLAWLDQVPEPRRAEALAAWAAKRAEVESEFKPESRPRALAGAAAMLRQEYAQ